MTTTSATWFRLTQPDGTSCVGVIQGCGGVIAHSREALGRLTVQKLLAVAGRPLGIYEPVTGHVCMYMQYGASGHGDAIHLPIDLCTIEVVASPGDQVPL